MSHPRNYRLKGPQIGSDIPSALGLVRMKNGKIKKQILIDKSQMIVFRCGITNDRLYSADKD